MCDQSWDDQTKNNLSINTTYFLWRMGTCTRTQNNMKPEELAK